MKTILLKEPEVKISFDETPLLCDHCKAYGYCIGEANVKLDDLFIKPASEREIRNWVNVQTEVKEVGTNYSKKLQQAHDLFHQEDFEQASYLYLDILQTRNDCTEAAIGLSASYYFLGYFNKALSYASYLPKSIDQSFLNRFYLQCEIINSTQ
jgi:thioredoxin-like negative regulator of GroEL